MVPPGNQYNQVDAEAFINELLDLIQEKRLSIGGDPNEKVLNFQQPKDLQKVLSMEITKNGATKDEMLNLCSKAIENCVKTGHRHFFNQFYSSVDTYSLGGAFLVEALNTNQHTYEVAPVFILAEKYMLSKISSYLKFKEYDGIFVPGGSIGNMMGVHVARFRHNRDVKQKGIFGSQRLIMFASADSHYSLMKGASFMGFGTDSCVMVKTDARGRMDTADLKAKVNTAKENGEIPLFVCATAGTTVLGAFDPINAIADICQEHGMWMHVDAAWGGGVLLSDNQRHRMDGVHRADSVLWNFHKMLRTSLQCSAFIVQHSTLLLECNGTNASYLFQPDKGYDTSFDTPVMLGHSQMEGLRLERNKVESSSWVIMDLSWVDRWSGHLGDKTVQCGRKADAFKLWVQWRARGDEGLAWVVDHMYDNARHLTESIKASAGFRLTMPEFECTNICFWYIPPSVRGQPETEEWWQKIHKVSAKVKDRMMIEGTMMIGYQPLPDYGWVNFFRIIISNPDLTTKDMDFVVSEIERLGNDL